MAFEWLVSLAARPERSGDVLALTKLLLKELPLPDPAADMTAAGLALHRLRPALDLVAEVMDRPVTIEDAAARCHLSPTYFSRAFSKQFGVGFSEYARQYRLRAAARSLGQFHRRHRSQHRTAAQILRCMAFVGHRQLHQHRRRNHAPASLLSLNMGITSVENL